MRASNVYGKIFASMFSGSLYGDWEAIVTLTVMVVLADKHGDVDMTPEVLSARTSIPLDIIRRGIASLEAPDPKSRTPDDEGRRILRVSDTRDWGWRITNYNHYREMRCADERREYLRQHQSTRRAKLKEVNVDSGLQVSTLSTEAVSRKQKQRQRKDMSPDQPASLDTADLRHPSSSAATVKDPSWVLEAMALYESEIGMIPFGRLGKALKPAVKRYGWGARHDNQVHEWFEAYCRHKPLMRANGTTPDVIGKGEPLIRNTQFCSPEDFVKNLTFWGQYCTRPAPDPNIIDARRLVAP